MSNAVCEQCELCQNSENPCMMGVGNKKARIMFIQDSPGELDDKHGEPFSGKSCTAIRKAMTRRDIDIDDIYYTSVVKCVAPKDEPKKAHVDACVDLLEAEVRAVDPDIIVPVGKLALRFCVGASTLTKMRGNAQEAEICGRTRIVLPTMHPRQTRVKPIYKEYILKDLDTLEELYHHGMTQVEGVEYKSLETLDEVVDELTRMQDEAEIISFDLETNCLSPFAPNAKIVCISLTDREHYGVVIPLWSKESPFWGYERGTVVKLLRYLLEDESIPKVAHNGKFDIEWLYYWLDIDVKNFSFDTMLAHYLCISEEQGTQGLKSQAWEFTDMGGYDNELDEFRKTLPEAERSNFDNIPWDILKKYAAADVDCCLRLRNIYKPMIDENDQWSVIMNDIMMPASYALRDIEGRGMKFDSELADYYSITYGAEIARIQSRLETYPEVLEMEREKQALYRERETIALIPKKERTEEEQKKFETYKKYQDWKFNWGSTVALRELLFDRLGLVTTITTDTGEPSTNKEAIKEMEDQHEIPMLLSELRKVTTLNNMFIQKLPPMQDKQHIVHPSFNISGTVTGRMSSENPNAQQFPRKAEDPELFQYSNEPKSLFISRWGDKGCIMNADYSALEMRIAGIISEDSTLLQAFNSGQDLHKSTASLVWGVPIDEVGKDLRTSAKAVNFGIIYGKSGATFAKDLYYDPSGTHPDKTDDWDEARDKGFKLVNDYLDTFSGLARWLNNTKKFAYKHGYVETMFGRRRRLPDLKSKVPAIQANAERQAINAPIQGTGSDFTLLSVIQINKWFTDNNLKSMIICTVHDSLVFDIYIPELPVVAPMVLDIMEHVHEPYIDTPVPVVADLELGTNYGSVFEISREECEAISSVADFKEWNKAHKTSKYKKEIDTFHSRGYDYKQLLVWMNDHNRPVRELSDYIVEVYSEDE